METKIETNKEYHCLYAGLLNGRIEECHFPGMECVDASCSGYDDCQQYKIGSRKINDQTA